jgi:hypothetical protein
MRANLESGVEVGRVGGFEEGNPNDVRFRSARGACEKGVAVVGGWKQGFGGGRTN